jgi:hypothetical protein
MILIEVADVDILYDARCCELPAKLLRGGRGQYFSLSP